MSTHGILSTCAALLLLLTPVAALEQVVHNIEELRAALADEQVSDVRVVNDLLFDDEVLYSPTVKLTALTPLVQHFVHVYGDCVDDEGVPRQCDVDANSKLGRVFSVLGDNTSAGLTLSNMVFRNAMAVNTGGSVVRALKGVTVNIHNCTFINNGQGAKGGVLQMTNNAYLTVTDSQFYNNSAVRGGAIYMETGSLARCTFDGNSATKSGGSIQVSLGTLELEDGTFVNNAAPDGFGEDIYRNCAKTMLMVTPFPLADTNVNGCDGGVVSAPDASSFPPAPTTSASPPPSPSPSPSPSPPPVPEPPQPKEPEEEVCIVSGLLSEVVSCDLDINGDGVVNIVDVQGVINTVLSLGGFDNAVPEGEEGCVVPGFLMNVVSCAIDANKDGQVDVNDAVFILNAIL